MATTLNKYIVGDVRPSQLLHTFGVGSVIDLPNLSVMLMGLDDWDTQRALEIGEERLLTAVQRELGQQVQRLLGPPRDTLSSTTNPFAPAAQIGVPVATFPRWLLCPSCRLLAPLDSSLFQLKTISPDRSARATFTATVRSLARHPRCCLRAFSSPASPATLTIFPGSSLSIRARKPVMARYA